MRQRKWTQETIIDFIKLALAAFLILMPWVFGYTSTYLATRNAWISGAVIGLLSIGAIVALAEWEEWLSLLFGLWVAVSPWALGYYATAISAMRADVVVGGAIALFAVAELWMMRRNPPHVTA